jgi:hypothetical protein
VQRADEAVGDNQVCFHFLGSHSLPPLLLLLIGAAKRPSVAEKPITVVEEKEPEH